MLAARQHHPPSLPAAPPCSLLPAVQRYSIGRSGLRSGRRTSPTGHPEEPKPEADTSRLFSARDWSAGRHGFPDPKDSRPQPAAPHLPPNRAPWQEGNSNPQLHHVLGGVDTVEPHLDPRLYSFTSTICLYQAKVGRAGIVQDEGLPGDSARLAAPRVAKRWPGWVTRTTSSS